MDVGVYGRRRKGAAGAKHRWRLQLLDDADLGPVEILIVLAVVEGLVLVVLVVILGRVILPHQPHLFLFGRRHGGGRGLSRAGRDGLRRRKGTATNVGRG